MKPGSLGLAVVYISQSYTVHSKTWWKGRLGEGMCMPWLFTLTSFKFKVQKQSKTISTNRITANDHYTVFHPLVAKEKAQETFLHMVLTKRRQMLYTVL